MTLLSLESILVFFLIHHDMWCLGCRLSTIRQTNIWWWWWWWWWCDFSVCVGRADGDGSGYRPTHPSLSPARVIHWADKDRETSVVDVVKNNDNETQVGNVL